MALNQLQYMSLSKSVIKYDDVRERLLTSGKDEDISPFTAVDTYEFHSLILFQNAPFQYCLLQRLWFPLLGVTLCALLKREHTIMSLIPILSLFINLLKYYDHIVFEVVKLAQTWEDLVGWGKWEYLQMNFIIMK